MDVLSNTFLEAVICFSEIAVKKKELITFLYTVVPLPQQDAKLILTKMNSMDTQNTFYYCAYLQLG